MKPQRARHAVDAAPLDLLRVAQHLRPADTAVNAYEAHNRRAGNGACMMPEQLPSFLIVPHTHRSPTAPLDIGMQRGHAVERSAPSQDGHHSRSPEVKNLRLASR